VAYTGLKMPLETPRLRLLAYTPAHLLALVEGDRAFEEHFGFPPAPGLRDFIVSADISPAWLARLRTAPAADVDPWTFGFAVVHREAWLVIGTAGFKGPPDADGTVEIAYGIVPDHQNRGYATEAAAALVAFAVGDGRVRLVRAHTLPTPNASTRVLTKCGFGRVGDVVDPEDGAVWRWERRTPAA
jgi:[ribosomal protein S5]-alanine N-acetyltransferase